VRASEISNQAVAPPTNGKVVTESDSVRRELFPKNPAMNSETSPSRCKPRWRSPGEGASSASVSSTTKGFRRTPSGVRSNKASERENSVSRLTT